MLGNRILRRLGLAWHSWRLRRGEALTMRLFGPQLGPKVLLVERQEAAEHMGIDRRELEQLFGLVPIDNVRSYDA